MYAQIFPRQKTKTGQFFEYKIPPNLIISERSLVEIPFGSKKTIGLVAKIVDKSKYADRDIIRSLTGGPVFTKLQINLAEKIALEHFSTLAETIFSFLPVLNKRDLKKIGRNISPRVKRQSRKKLLLGSLDSALELFIQSTNLKNTQILIVLPTISEVEKTRRRLRKLLPQKQIFSWHSNLSSSEKANLWQKCLGAKELIVVSTRHGLFLPFTCLESVLIFDPTNFAYQDDQAPYYNAYKAALYLANIAKCDLNILESSPDLLSYAALKQGKIELVETKSRLEISNGLRWRDLSKNIKVFGQIKSALTENKRVCVIGPLKNQIKLFCEDCKKIQSCPGCKNNYFDQTSLACINCRSIFTSCGDCQSPKIKSVGFSYTKVKAELTKLFGRYAKNIIVISPREIASLAPPIDLVVFPYFDAMASFPYLGYRQKLFRLVFSLESLSAKKIILFGDGLAENNFASNLIAKNWRAFLADEIRERSSAQLPPFTRAIEIVAKNKSAEGAKNILEKILPKITGEFSPILLEPEARPASSGVNSRSCKYTAAVFVRPVDFEKFKKVALANQSKGLHFELDRGEYL